MAQTLTIHKGPIDALDYPSELPIKEWPELIRARASYLRIHLPHDCRELLRFVDEAHDMAAPLGYASTADLIRQGLGLDPQCVFWAIDGLKRLKPEEPIPFVRAIELGRHGGDRKSEAVRVAKENQVSNRNLIYSGGTNRTYLVSRLARDHPDVLQRMQAGEYRSVRAAAKAAGIVKDKTPLQSVQAAWRKADAEERQRIVQWLLGQIDDLPEGHHP